MASAYRHLVRPPIPVDHEMPYVMDGVLENERLVENVAKAFPNDEYEQLIMRILLYAARDNPEKEFIWSGVNSAYIEWVVSVWWSYEVGNVWYWFLKILWFHRSYVMARVNVAMGRLIAAGLIEELIEWDLIEEGEYYGITSNQKMPVYYPTAALVDRLNETVI